MDRASDGPQSLVDAGPSASELRGSVLDVVTALLAENDRDAVLEIVRKLVDDNTEMSRRLARIRARFKSSEKISTAQLVIFLDALQRGDGEPEVDGPGDANEVDDADESLRDASGIDGQPADDENLAALRTRKPGKQPRMRAPAPDTLRRVDNLIAVPTQLRACPKCGSERQCIGHDVTEVIDLIPAEVIVRRDLREKLACSPCEGEIVRAPVGEKIVAGGKLGIGFVAAIFVDKYMDGLPLHRQSERFQRLGFDLSVSTLADQVKWCCELLRPLWRASVAEVIAAHVMHIDGTGLAVLDRNAPGGKRMGALWGYVGMNGDEKIAAYMFVSTGKKSGYETNELGPEDILGLRTGLTVADASNLFDASFKRPELIECGCNMHARRYFVKALDAGDKRAALALAAYKKIYAIEADITGLNADAKLAERRKRAQPVWNELVQWCRVRKKHEPPSTRLGAALRYFTNHEVALARFLEYGIVPLDNGAVERLHVRTALTRKNYLFAGADSGGERAAIAYTILGSCRLAGIDPIAYLADVLPRLTQRIRLVDLSALLPSRWAAARTTSTTY